MLHLATAILLGLATICCSQHVGTNKVQAKTLVNEEDSGKVKITKRSSDCASLEDMGSDLDKRSWNNMQASWGKRKWQDMRNPGWGKRSPAPTEFDRNIQSNLQTSFQEDKRGWKDMQGASWGKRGWQDMRQQSWGKRGWKDMQASSWGKRGWQDMQGNWGKRGWQDMQGLNWGKRKWQDLQSSAWGKRGWKELQTSGWGKRSVDQADDKRGWGDMKISGYGKRAWNDIHSSGWGKRGWKEMQAPGWGKRLSVDQEETEALGQDWDLPLRPDMIPEDTSRDQGGKHNLNEWRLNEPLDPHFLLYKLLEGLQNASWSNRGFNLKKTMEEDGVGAGVEHNP